MVAWSQDLWIILRMHYDHGGELYNDFLAQTNFSLSTPQKHSFVLIVLVGVSTL